MFFDSRHKKMVAAIEQLIMTKTHNTKRAYAYVWNSWLEFMCAKKLHKTDVGDVGRYLDEIAKRTGQRSRYDGNTKAAPSTISHRLSTLNGFYDHCLKLGIIKTNPFANSCFDHLRKVKYIKRPTQMLEFQHVLRLIASPPSDTNEGIRDRAILALLFGGALRRSEVIAIRMADVKKHATGLYSVFLRDTKNGESVRQFLAPWASPFISALIKQRLEEGATDFCFLVVNYYFLGPERKKPLDNKTIYRILKTYADQCKLGDFLTPHSARATAITRLLELGVPAREVRKFSRHATIQSVELYDKKRSERASKVAKALSY